MFVFLFLLISQFVVDVRKLQEGKSQPKVEVFRGSKNVIFGNVGIRRAADFFKVPSTTIQNLIARISLRNLLGACEGINLTHAGHPNIRGADREMYHLRGYRLLKAETEV